MMKYHNHHKLGQALGGIFVALVFFASAISNAAVDSSTVAGSGLKVRQALSERMVAINDRIQAKDANASTFLVALKEIQQLENEYRSDVLTDFELAQLANLSGYTNFLQSDYPSAISDYKRVVEFSNGVPELQAASFLTIAQLYYSIKEFHLSLQYIDQLIQKAESQDQIPEERWLVLQKACWAELDKPDDQVFSQIER